jgi:hypothetical protein
MIPTWLVTDAGTHSPDGSPQSGPLLSPDGEQDQKTED